MEKLVHIICGRPKLQADGSRGMIPDKFFIQDSELHSKIEDYAEAQFKNDYIYIDRNCIVRSTTLHFYYENEFFQKNRRWFKSGNFNS